LENFDFHSKKFFSEKNLNLKKEFEDSRIEEKV